MPIYMDAHFVPGVNAREVAKAHHKDVLLQEGYGCKCMTYWVDEERETVFCLVDAPDKDTVRKLHSEAHGLIPNKIIEVSNSIVQSFLGRIYDPEHTTVENGLKIFSDTSYRILLLLRTKDIVLLRQCLGNEAAGSIMNRLNELVRKNIGHFEGREAEYTGESFVISFSSAINAISCARSIQKDLTTNELNALNLRMAVTGGEPVQDSPRIFGESLQFAERLLSIAQPGEIRVAAAVQELAAKDFHQKNNNHFRCLSIQDEVFINTLFAELEDHWHEPGFDIPEYCLALAISQSQLYRKTTSLTGLSFNTLLRDYRLEKAKELLKKKSYSVSQVTFESGFSSPSYFTKCFKGRYGILPLTYIRFV